MKGFTLIEVIVSISVALLLTGFIISNYNNYNDIQTLRQAALTLKNDLRYAQTKASTGEKPTPTEPVPTPSPIICSQLSGYTINFTVNTYTVTALCSPQGAIGEVKNYTLPSGITFSPLPNPASVLFKVLSNGTNLPSNETITMSGFGKTYQIQITTQGEINDIGLQ